MVRLMIRAACQCALMCLCLFAAQARAMPETAGEWRSTREDAIPLALGQDGAESVGRWTRRVYERESPRGTVEVNFMEGSGPGPLRILRPEGVPENAADDNAVLDAKSEYRVLDVAGRRAVLERVPLLPAALAVSVEQDSTLTLEGNVTDEELAALAVEIIKAIDGAPVSSEAKNLKGR